MAAAACVLLIFFSIKHGLAQASSLAGVLALPVGVVAAAAGVWAVLPHEPRSAAEGLNDLADGLAEEVKTQWEKEVKSRGFGGPHPLRVSWKGETEYFESWADLERTARDADSGDGRVDDAKWATDPDQLSGSDDTPGAICDVLEKIPTGRLVTLGEPGAGKSMLLIHLAQQLLNRRGSGDPVPMIVSLAQWDPEEDDLYEWLLTRISIDRTNLRLPFVLKGQKTTRGDALLRENRILLILDGLDEIPEESRNTAIENINDMLGESRKVVLACRKEEYGKATRPKFGDHVSLLGAAGVTLQDLTPQEVAHYLARGAGSPTAAARWDPVVAVLGTDSVLGKTLTTPLTVTLAHSVYNSGPRTQPGPAELLDEHNFPTGDSIKEHLFAVFIAKAYRPSKKHGETQPPPVEHALRWLTFLARNPGLSWWELPTATKLPLVELVIGAVCGIAAGVAAISATRAGVGVGFGLGVGIAAGLLPVFVLRSARSSPGGERAANAEDPTPARGIAGGLLGGIVGGIAAGVAGTHGFGHAASVVSGMPVALGVGLATGACTTFGGGIAGGLIGGFAAGILEGIETGRTAAVVNGLGIALVVMVIIRLVGRDTPAARRSWEYKLGIPGGVVVGAATAIIASFKEGPAVGLLLGVPLGIISAWPIGLRGIKTARSAIPPAPRRALARDARAFWSTAMAAGLAAGAFGFGGDGLASVIEVHAKLTFAHMVSDGLAIGIASGLIVGFAFGAYHSASPGFLITRVWFSLQGELPWAFMGFLEDAHVIRHVLRQNGASYEFTHVELQRYLARSADAGAGSGQPPGFNLGVYRRRSPLRARRGMVTG